MFVNPSSLFTAHLGQESRLFSPRLWKEAKGSMLAPDGSLRGSLIVEDFKTFGGLLDSDLSATVGTYIGQAGHYYSYQDTGNTIAQLATDPNGVIAISTDGTDNDECWLQPGSATSVSGMISNTAGSDKVLVFEARVRPNKVANDEMAWFVGLTQEGRAVADQKADNTGVLADVDFIGFDVVQADGDALNVVYNVASGASSPVTLISGVQALTAATWYNIGLIYNPREVTTKRIKFFVNNVEQSTYGTGTIIGTAAAFPNGEELQPLFGIKNGSAAAASLDLDGWALYYGA